MLGLLFCELPIYDLYLHFSLVAGYIVLLTFKFSLSVKAIKPLSNNFQSVFSVFNFLNLVYDSLNEVFFFSSEFHNLMISLGIKNQRTHLF